MTWRSIPIAAALGLLLASSAWAAPNPKIDGPCAIAADIREAPPPNDGAPVDLKIGVVLVDLSEVNDVDQSFRADLVVSAIWSDPRLAKKARGGALSDCRLTLKDIWQPDVRPVNLRIMYRDFNRSLRIADDGTVRFEVQALALFSTRLQLKDFPFDIQRLRVRFASFSHGVDEVRFVPIERKTNPEREFSIAGWNVINDQVDAKIKPMQVDYTQLARVDYVILVARDPGYYLWNFVVPLALIVLMAWSVFWIDPESWGTQVGIATASAFTLVAFMIALRSRLPAVPYLTRLDELVLSSTLLVFTALAQVVVTSRLAQTNRLSLARRVDAYGRWIYLGLFASAIYLTLVR